MLSRLGNNRSVGKGLMQVGQGVLRVGETLGIVAVGATVASAKIGASFQSMTELIHTQAGAQQSEVDAMRLGIQAMVHEVGTSPQELAKGIYHIESVGLRGAQALDVLKASALGAKVGLADMESVTNALTAVTYSNIKGTKDASDAMAVLDGIVGVGNMHLQDLTDSFKSGILGTGAAFGVTLQSLGAAIATLTDAGVPANIAATRLNMTISHMGAPTAKAIDTLKTLGISQFQLATDMRGPNGIDAALRDIGTHLQNVGEMSASGVLTPAGVADLTKIFGGSRFGATAMQLLTNAMADAAHGGDRLAQKYKLIGDRQKTFNDNVVATKQTASYVFGLLVADIQNAALAFSQGFLPALARAGAKLDTFLFSHQSDIKGLGVELGNWLDNINWTQVETGANTFLGILKTVLDVIGKIPPQVDAVVLSFAGLNKVSGGLFGKGLQNIVGGTAGALARLGMSKIPVVGGALSSMTAMHVWVDNFPVGFGGGLPGAAAVGAEAAAGAAGLTLGGAAIAVAVPTVLIGGALLSLNDIADKAGANLVMSQKGLTNAEITAQRYYTANRADQETIAKRLMGHIPSRADYESGNAKLAGQIATAITPGGFDPRQGGGGVTAGGFTADFKASNITTNGFDKRITVPIVSAIQAAAKIRQASAHELQYMLKGIAARGEKKVGHAPSQSAVMGTFGRDLLRYTHTLVGSSKTTADKIAGVEHWARIAVAAKDWDVARKLKAEIAHLKAQQAADTTKLGHNLGTIASEILKQKFKVTVGGPTVITNVRIGVGETIKTTTTARKLGNVFIS